MSKPSKEFFFLPKPFDELHEIIRQKETHVSNCTRTVLCFVNMKN